MSILFNKRVQTDKDVSPPVLSFSSIVQDTIIDYGGSGTLTSTAQAINPSTGTAASGTINYQWYKDGVAISGANSASLNLTNQLTAANYYCIASFIRSGTTAPAINSPITSRTARTTIRNNIVFTKQPQSKTVILEKSATFSCSAYPNPKSMSGFNPNLYGGSGFGDADYNAALSQGFSDADIRYYLEQVWTGKIGPNMMNRLNDANWGTNSSRNLVYEWYVNGVLTKTTRGNVTSQVSGFNGQGLYLDLSNYIGRVLVEFNVSNDTMPYQRIRIPDLATINGGINAPFLKDGYLQETLPNVDTLWGNHKLLLDGGRIYGPITSDNVGSTSGYIVSAGEIGTGGYDTLELSTGNDPASSTKQMRVSVNKGFFKTYVDPSNSTTLTLTFGGVTFAVNQPPRDKHFSTLDLTSSVVSSSSVYCKVRQENVSGDLAPPPVNSSTATFTSTTANCISWDDSRKPGGYSFVVTNSGIKPAPVSVWYGPWVYGTDNDTCYTFFDIEVRDIYPRAVNSNTDSPFSALFQCRIRGNGGGSGDVINAYKILEWDGNNRVDNENRKQTLRFNSDSFDGQEVIGYGDNGRILFRQTNSNAPGNRISWNPPGSGKIAIDILFLDVKRKSDGSGINSFLTVNSTRTDNILEYGRRFDQYEDPY